MPVQGFKLPTKFYGWFRKNVEKIVLLADQQNASAQHIAAQLGWKRAADMKEAMELIRKHGAAIHNGDWTGVEQDLFAPLCSYYLDLPSVRRVLHELGDKRVTTPPPAPRKRPTKKRSRKPAQGQGRENVPAVAPESTAPVAPTTAPAVTKPADTSVPATPNAFRKAQTL